MKTHVIGHSQWMAAISHPAAVKWLLARKFHTPAEDGEGAARYPL